jgi:DnaD/phage-associated family protein
VDYSQEGNLSRYDAEDIAGAAEWDGDADKFVQALLECGYKDSKGFLERDAKGSLTLHDWDDYAGRLLDQRRANAERARKSRERKRTVREACGDALPDIPDTTASDEGDNSSCPDALQSVPSRDVTTPHVTIPTICATESLQPMSPPPPTVVPPARRTAQNASTRAAGVSVDEDDLRIAIDFAQKNLGHLGVLRPIELDKLREWHKQLSGACLVKAMEEAILNGKPNWKYIGAICERWIKRGVTQVEDIVSLERDFEFRKNVDKQAQQRDTFAPLSDEDKRKADELTRQLAERFDINKAVRK